MQGMLQGTKDAIERKLSTPARKGYAMVANPYVQSDASDRLISEHLRSDGWHLDEVDDDDDLDFALPPSRHRQSESKCPKGCTNVVVCCTIS